MPRPPAQARRRALSRRLRQGMFRAATAVPAGVGEPARLPASPRPPPASGGGTEATGAPGSGAHRGRPLSPDLDRRHGPACYRPPPFLENLTRSNDSPRVPWGHVSPKGTLLLWKKGDILALV
ncbi:MAG: hypothetical protein OXU61_08305 [Gammaproteobacteria bacterium]|nr:hypothetical protein [Gammaproteobacteria bacterium]